MPRKKKDPTAPVPAPAEPVHGDPPSQEPPVIAPAVLEAAPILDAGVLLYRDRSGPVREKSPTEGAANFASAMHAALHPDLPPEAA